MKELKSRLKLFAGGPVIDERILSQLLSRKPGEQR